MPREGGGRRQIQLIDLLSHISGLSNKFIYYFKDLIQASDSPGRKIDITFKVLIVKGSYYLPKAAMMTIKAIASRWHIPHVDLNRFATCSQAHATQPVDDLLEHTTIRGG